MTVVASVWAECGECEWTELDGAFLEAWLSAVYSNCSSVWYDDAAWCVCDVI